MSSLFVPSAYWGTKLTSLWDDEFQLVVFSGGFGFEFYGIDYTQVYVNANGNITFNQGDGDYRPDFDSFINDVNPRIAPYWSDLLPNDAAEPDGGVFVAQFEHAAIMTWAKIPYFPAGSIPYPKINTFQLALFDNGIIGMAYDTLDNNLPALSSSFYYPLIGIAAGSGGDSKIFKYDGVTNQDPENTVTAPIGILNNSRIYFIPEGSSYTMATMLIQATYEVV